MSAAPDPHAPPRPRRHGRLFWRVYLHGLALLAIVAVVVGTAGALLRRAWPPEAPGRIAMWTAARISDVRDDPARLRAELERAKQAFGVTGTVWSQGRILASTAEPPLPPPRRGQLERMRDRDWPIRLHGHPPVLGIALEGHPPAVLALTGMPSPFSHARVGLLGLLLLAALALGSVPLARGISAPLERLTAVVKRFGRGDLSARAKAGGPGEVGELSRAFDEMADRLERLVRSEKELLANVSHELRTPLSRIRVALALAEEGDAERARRALRDIEGDLAELEGLVDDVLTTARLDLGSAAQGFPLRRRVVPVGGVLEQAAQRFRVAHPDRLLAVDLAGALPELEADPALLRRALDNLLDNAAKYSEAPAPVALSAAARGGAVEIAVADRGIGIDPADQPRVFTPFHRSDRSRARGTGGVGLGLALAKRIVEAHGGTIALESAPGVGTTVTLRLPVPPASAAPAA